MASLDILCSNQLNLKYKITKIEHKKTLCDPSEISKNISWPINICLEYFMIPTKTLRPHLLHTKCKVPKMKQIKFFFTNIL